jgi:interferon gamma-inducible protein 30
MFLKQLFGLCLVLMTAECLKIKVQVYYESLCPDSRQFINTQLAPVGKDLLQYLDIKFIPFGKSNYSTLGSDVRFDCHHGPNECYGNKIHACIIENVQTDSYRPETREQLILQYIDCMMGLSRQDAEFPIEKCATNIKYKNWENIRDCANFTSGSKLLQQFGDQTMNFQNPLQSVPTIVFKDKYDMDVQRRALADFQKLTCDMLKTENIRAVECFAHGAGSHVTGFTMVTLMLTAAMAFIH